MVFRFAFVADTHYLAGATANSDREFQRLTSGAAIFEELLRQLGEFEPAFVIHGGDAVCGGSAYKTPAPQVEESLRHVRAFGDRLGVPWHYVLGNHDTPTAVHSKDAFLSILGCPAAGGRAYRSFVHEDLRFLLLDSLDGTPPRVTSRIGAAQLEWLEAELRHAARAGEEALLFSHLLLHPGPFARVRWLRGVAIENAAQVSALLDRHDHVRAAFIGHLHRNQVYERRGVSHVVSPATICYPMMWRAVTVEPDRIVVQSRQLALPEVLAASYAARPAVGDEQMGLPGDREFMIRRRPASARRVVVPGGSVLPMTATYDHPFRQRLLDEMAALPTVDCHSHTMLRREYEQPRERSLFTIQSYFARDFQATSGRPWSSLAQGPDDERWAQLRDVLARARNVSYWRHNIATYQGVFDFTADDVTDANWRALNERIKAYTSRPDWYDYVTRTKCNLITQVRNVPWYEEWEPEYFTAILRMESALRLHEPEVRHKLAAHLDRDLTEFASLRRALADFVASYVARGAIGIKLAHAYWRSLSHENVPESTASQIWTRVVRGDDVAPADVTALQDHVVWFLAGLCADMGLVFQIHTGMQGNWGHIPDSDPLGLCDLLRAHRSVKFDLFHAGYPYAREIGVLGKHYPNVWLNACWIYLITMAGSRQFLSEWIDLVPAERLLGFGSDLQWPEMIYGHLAMARACIADVLAEKVERDFLSRAAALDLVRLMLRDAPAQLYRLPDAALSANGQPRPIAVTAS